MIVKPVFIVGHPRSGTSLVRLCLASSPTLWSIGREGSPIWEQRLHPRFFGWRSNAVPAEHASPEIIEELRAKFQYACRAPTQSWSLDDKVFFLRWMQAQGVRPQYYDLPDDVLRREFGDEEPEGPPAEHEVDERTPFCFPEPSRAPTPAELEAGIRMLEKSIQNCWRLEFVERVFPDALFVFVVRHPKTSIASSMDAWRHPRKFFSYKVPRRLRIEGYSDAFPWGDEWWNLSLPPGWEEVTDEPLERVCAHSWVESNEAILNSLPRLQAEGRGTVVRYEDLLAAPATVLDRLASFADIELDVARFADGMPAVMTVTAPHPEKWRRHEERLRRIRPTISGLAAEFGYDQW